MLGAGTDLSLRPGTRTGVESAAPIAIIGAGFSGVAAAIHLLKKEIPRRILLFERADRFGRGLAYQTADACHFLNVPADRMSVHEDEPDDFVRFLGEDATHLAESLRTPLGVFATRNTYGRYLAGTLREVLTNAIGAPRLSLVADEVVDLVPSQGGFLLVDAMGRTHSVACVVLAHGYGTHAGSANSTLHPYPWDLQAVEDLQGELPVMIVGTGLSMVDAVLSIRKRSPGTRIVAISRRGLLPRPHAAIGTQPEHFHGEVATLRELVRTIRRKRGAATRADEGDWRGRIDGLRSSVQRIWQALPLAEKKRFSRHLRPWWDTHRHRMARPIAERISRMIADGDLRIERGTIVDIDDRQSAAVVTWRRRGEVGSQKACFERVIDARGPDRTESLLTDNLQQNMNRRGLTRSGPLGIGIDVTRDLLVIGRSGMPHPRLWALGPITRGVFWECTAVPEIRQQAKQLGRLAANLSKIA